MNNGISNELFTATCKLNTLQTLLCVIVDIVEEDVSLLSAESIVAYHNMQRNKITDLLHIANNGISDTKSILENLNIRKGNE